MKKTNVKVTQPARDRNVRMSGIPRANQSTTNTRSAAAKRVIQVLDENGKVVTPKPLHHPNPGAVPKQSNIFTCHDAFGATASDLFSITHQTTSASLAGPFTKSVFGSSTMSRSSQSTMGSMSDEPKDSSSKSCISTGLFDVQVRREEAKEQIREDMSHDEVDILLSETDTIWLQSYHASPVSVESEEAAAVKEKNRKYTMLCESMIGNEKYMERMMQTFNGAPKTKHVQSETVIMVDTGFTVTTWDMYDTVSSSGTGQTTKPTEKEKPVCLEAASDHKHNTARGSGKTTSIISSIGSESGTSLCLDAEDVIEAKYVVDPQLILQSETFQQSLFVMERILLENILQPKLAAYRQLPILKDPYSDKADEDAGKTVEKEEDPPIPALEPLWSYSCELTAGLSVTCMTWNKQNPDLLAVGYGTFESEEDKPGLVCCWSQKNPMWPERIRHCDSTVTALDFSASNSGQLAVGLKDGNVATYRMRSNEEMHTVDSSKCLLRHHGAVRQVKWINMGRNVMEDKDETLISASDDGRVCKWPMRVDVECIDLMKLKREEEEDEEEEEEGEEEEEEGEGEAVIVRYTPGLCFDFHAEDSSQALIYLVGTEDGYIHKCSSLHNDQYSETYRGHGGTVHKVTWSPFCPDIFLSCAEDCTVQLWRQDLKQPLAVFKSGQRPVFDVVWSPKWATVFGTVSKDRVEIWNLGSSTQYPTIVRTASIGAECTSLLFATGTNCILVGENTGKVHVYQLRNLNVGEGPEVDMFEEIIRSTLSSQH